MSAPPGNALAGHLTEAIQRVQPLGSQPLGRVALGVTPQSSTEPDQREPWGSNPLGPPGPELLDS